MGPVVEFQYGRHGEVPVAKYEVCYQAVESITDRVGVLAVPDVDDLGQRDLRQDHMIWKGANQSLIEILRYGGKELLRADRPRTCRCAIARFPLADDNNQQNRSASEHKNNWQACSKRRRSIALAVERVGLQGRRVCEHAGHEFVDEQRDVDVQDDRQDAAPRSVASRGQRRGRLPASATRCGASAPPSCAVSKAASHRHGFACLRKHVFRSVHDSYGSRAQFVSA